MGVVYSDFFKPDVTPKWRDSPTFDPVYGFEDKRQKRKMIATEDQMEAAALDPTYRDYCAHKLIDYEKCRAEKWPFRYRCEHQQHAWDSCQFDDFVLRMKEYERERRLLERSKRKQAAAM